MELITTQIISENQKLEFDIHEKPPIGNDEKLSLNALFIKNSTSLKRGSFKPFKKGILKKNNQLLKSEYVFTQDEEAMLKNLIYILGLNVTDISEFLIKTSNFLNKDPTSKFKIKRNIKNS